MHLYDYFDFLSDDDIRIRGTRIGVESVLYEAIHRARTPKQIARAYRTLSLEQVYATLLLYERERERLDEYLADYLRHCEEARDRFWADAPPLAARLRNLRAKAERTTTEAAPTATV